MHQVVQQAVYAAVLMFASQPGQPAPEPPAQIPRTAGADVAPGPPPRDQATSRALVHARTLYASEIGCVTPLVDGELRRLSEQHPDPSAWDTAFREAVRANVRQLRYVGRVLEARAKGTCQNPSPTGGYHVHRKKPSRSPGRPARSRPGGRLTEEDYAELQRRASAIEPLDLLATLGTTDA